MQSISSIPEAIDDDESDQDADIQKSSSGSDDDYEEEEEEEEDDDDIVILDSDDDDSVDQVNATQPSTKSAPHAMKQALPDSAPRSPPTDVRCIVV